jgi:hypothetical protein
MPISPPILPDHFASPSCLPILPAHLFCLPLPHEFAAAVPATELATD